MNTKLIKDSWLAVVLLLGPVITLGDDAHEFHDDYYFGFSQGAYYGLMLAGVDYHVAWCMKSELEYEARNLGTGGEFQQNIERLLAQCRRSVGQD